MGWCMRPHSNVLGPPDRNDAFWCRYPALRAVLEPEREHFEALLHRTPRWLFNALQVLDRPYDAIVIDTPPGASGYLSQVLTASSVVVGVALADAGSYVTLPQLQSLVETYCGSSPHFKRFGVVVNQVDHNKPLNRDVVSMIKAAFPDHVIGLVHEDESVCEALAYGPRHFHLCTA